MWHKAKDLAHVTINMKRRTFHASDVTSPEKPNGRPVALSAPRTPYWVISWAGLLTCGSLLDQPDVARRLQLRGQLWIWLLAAPYSLFIELYAQT